jgi:acyl-coenzyme A synthetase/AMP-(fatty) acid ligase
MEPVEMICMADLLRQRAEVAPKAVALLAENVPWLTHERLWTQVVKVARVLSALGVSPPDRVDIVLPDGPEMAMAFLCVSSVATAALAEARGGSRQRASVS